MRYRCDFDDEGFFDDSGGDSYEDSAGFEEEDDYEEGEDAEEEDAAEDEFDAASDDDRGDWSVEDYERSAEELFGDHEYFGDTLDRQLADEGYRLFDDSGFADGFERIAPGSSETVRLYERDGQLHAFGIVPFALASLLRGQYSGIDFSSLHHSVPLKGEIAEPRPLPRAYAAVEPKPAIDLRPLCSPVADQKDTSRCSAFAWTHAVELARTLDQRPCPRLSATYSMLQFQRMQGDAGDYEHAYEGGSGTVSGPEPGHVLKEKGTCRHELWPDDEEGPRASERQLASDAAEHRLEGEPHPIALEDAKKALSAGCPIHLGMNTGPAFTMVGRDGLISAAEPPGGRHGRHAMLLVGYNGNFYTAKNSWGATWGDGGYCYIPKNVLAASEPELIAVLR